MRGEKLETANAHNSVQKILCKGISWNGGDFVTPGIGIGAFTGACGGSVTTACIFSVKQEARWE